MLYRDRRMVSRILFVVSEGKLISIVYRGYNHSGKLGLG